MEKGKVVDKNGKEITLQDMYSILAGHIEEQKPLACLANKDFIDALTEVVKERKENAAFNRKLTKIGRTIGIIAAIVTSVSVIIGAAVLVLKSLLGLER